MRIVVRAPQMEVSQDYGNAFERNADQASMQKQPRDDESITCDIVWIDEMPEAKADEPADQKKKSDPVEDEGNDCGQKTGADGKRQGDRRGRFRLRYPLHNDGRAEKNPGMTLQSFKITHSRRNSSAGQKQSQSEEAAAGKHP